MTRIQKSIDRRRPSTFVPAARQARRPRFAFRPVWEPVEDRTLLSAVSWINPSGGDWDVAANWSTNTVPSAADDVEINFANVTVTHAGPSVDAVNGLSSLASIDISNGSLSLGAASTIAGDLTVSPTNSPLAPQELGVAGALTVAGAVTLKGGLATSPSNPYLVSGPGSITAVGTLTIHVGAGSGGNLLDGVALNSTGTGLIDGSGQVVLRNGASITNSGVMNLTGPANDFTMIVGDGSPSAGSFTNTNTGKITATGYGYFVQVPFNNDGSVKATGSGTHFAAENGTSDGSFVGDSGTLLDLVHETLTASSSLISSGDVTLQISTVAGSYNVAGVTSAYNLNNALTGNVTSVGRSLLLSNATLDVSPTPAPSAPLTVQNLSIQGQGSSLTGTQGFTVGQAFAWQVGGTLSVPTIDVQGDFALSGSGASYLVNTALTLHQNSTVTATGYLDLRQGAKIDVLSSGTLTFNSPVGGNFGVGSGDGTGSFVSDGHFQTLANEFVQVAIPTLRVSNAIAIHGGTLYFTGGPTAVIDGTVTGDAGTVLVLNNVALAATGQVHSLGSAVIVDSTVAGVYDVAGGTETGGYSGAVFTGPVITVGSYLTLDGAKVAFLPTQPDTTTLSIGTVTMAPGAWLTGSRNLVIRSSLSYNGGGSVLGSPGMTIDVTGSAAFHLSDPSFFDGLTLNLRGATTVDTAVPYEGRVLYEHGAVVNNLGTMAVNATYPIDFGSTGAGSGAFVNTGTLNVTGPQWVEFEASFTNAGTVAVAVTGSLLAFGADYHQTAGQTRLDGGQITVSSPYGDARMVLDGGSLLGTGTLNANVANNATAILPGGAGAAGLLTVVGTYTQGAAGSLAVELGGTAGSQYDRLVVMRAATLGGTINVATIGGYVPAIGTTFQPLTFGSHTGDFATYGGLDLGHCLTYAHALNPTDLTLTVQAAPPPVVAPISGPSAPVLTGAPVNLSAAFSQAMASETHTAVWAWGDGTTSVGTVVEANAAGTVVGSHTYASTGTFNVTVAVSDTGGCVGYQTFNVTVVPSILLLDRTASGALTLSGNAVINIRGNVLVDSNSPTAVIAGGNATVTSAGVRIVGGDRLSGGASLGSSVTTGAPYVADPLLGLPVPSAGVSQGAVSLAGNASLTIAPGVYSQIKVSGNAKLTMQAGVYVIAGGGLTVTGNASVTGLGVTVYNAGSSFPAAGGNFGGVALGGTGSIKLTAPTTGPYAGVVLFQARDNARALSFDGNGMAGTTGTLYAPAATLTLSGNAQVSLPLVVARLVLSGNASSALSTAPGDGGTDTAAGQLLAGDLFVALGPGLTSDERARVVDAVAELDVLLAPFSVTIGVVDPSSGQANLTLGVAAQSPLGGAAQGVLGCETDTTSGKAITIVDGWDWYAGADPGAVGARQFDFETAVVHELGHALGLGHSPAAASAMYASLNAGDSKRGMVVSDLNVPDTDSGPCGLMASVPRGPAAVAPVAAAPSVVMSAPDSVTKVSAARSKATAPPVASAPAVVAARVAVRATAIHLDTKAVDRLLDDGAVL